MNLYLDFTRCADWDENCPADCWRAKLTEYTETKGSDVNAVYTYAHFEGGPGCVKGKVKA